MKKPYILAIDQGTSSTKSTIFDHGGNPVARGQVDLKTHYHDGGFVEQDPEAICLNVLTSVLLCLKNFKSLGKDPEEIAAVGISNQRETFVVWDEMGKPLYNAIVWQCKRSIAICERIAGSELADRIKEITGLIVDPYFSGTKLVWLYENCAKVRQAINDGRAYFGTVDTWLLYKLTKGKHYLTDHTNASRTMFFNLNSLDWDNELIESLGLSGINLPEIRSSSSDFGSSSFNGFFDREVPILSMIGDSHAAAFGEGCFEKGQGKATLGTGCSIMMNAGKQLPAATAGIINTICWSTAERVEYALEGVIVSCGSTIEWLKRELGLFAEAKETQDMAESVPDNNGVYIIPAFSGLGAPYWDMARKGEIRGLTFDCNKKHIVRAGLESICFQIRDVIDAMKIAGGLDLHELSVNGGIVNNKFVLEYLVNLLESPICFGIPDASGLGAALLAGLQAGSYTGIEDIKDQMSDKRAVYPGLDGSNVQKDHAQWLYYLGYQHKLTDQDAV